MKQLLGVALRLITSADKWILLTVQICSVYKREAGQVDGCQTRMEMIFLPLFMQRKVCWGHSMETQFTRINLLCCDWQMHGLKCMESDLIPIETHRQPCGHTDRRFINSRALLCYLEEIAPYSKSLRSAARRRDGANIIRCQTGKDQKRAN